MISSKVGPIPPRPIWPFYSLRVVRQNRNYRRIASPVELRRQVPSVLKVHHDASIAFWVSWPNNFSNSSIWSAYCDISLLAYHQSPLSILVRSFGGLCGPPQGTELNSVYYSLGEGRNGEQEREENQERVSISSVADEDYKFPDLSEQFSNAGNELSEFNWKWFPLGIGGLACLLFGIGVYCFAKRRSIVLGITLTVVGWVCGQIGFIRWFN